MIVQHPNLPIQVNSETGEILAPMRNGSKPVWKKGSVINNCGYLMMQCNKKRYLVHRLVAEACIPNPDNLPVVDHINRDKHDNRACNLRWVTRSENSRNTDLCDQARDKFGFSSYEDPKQYKRLYNQKYYAEHKQEIMAQHLEYLHAKRERKKRA